MFYEFELGLKASEATKKHFCAKSEGTVTTVQ